MGTNTVGVLQMYSVVPSGQPNAGKDAIEDATDLDTYLKRKTTTFEKLASEINANAGILDISTSNRIVITMDESIPFLDLTGLDLVTNFDSSLLSIVIKFVQSGAGNFTVNAGDSILFGLDFGSLPLSGSVGVRDLAGFIYDKDLDKYLCVSFAKGFNNGS